VIGGAIAVTLWARWRGMLSLRLLDVAAVPLAVGYAVGRIGCQLSGDGDYGEPWDGPWAMGYPDGTEPTPPGVEVHPTPIYEALAMGGIAYLLWRWRDRFRPGVLFALYLTLAGLERFLVEFVRRNDAVVAGLTFPQLLSLAMIAAGVAWMAIVRNRAGSLRPGEPTAAEG
jgi:phosphatidylglycerol:prolipoprotein diacylglycerol transferase